MHAMKNENKTPEIETDECFVELSEETYKLLEKYCNKVGVSMEEALGKIIDQYLDKQAPVGA